ncbi:MAG TPA: tRNA epoxyqueuosine(34) reductase QueG [Candidatus Eisenbacteria bacterium]|nr:tRNA epoxyqueuosine(34) reductase QueG [Candidatus Eisenbacteria bacterium]
MPTASLRIKARALELGFSAAGIARIAPLEAQARYEAWLSSGRHGGMAWLASDRQRTRRRDPALILPGVRSVVCVALAHEPQADEPRAHRVGRVARYAVGEDYHRVMRGKLAGLELEIARLLPGARTLWYTDTGAILERGWAERAGLGWIGKHSGLLSSTIGSWFLLAEVLVDQDLEPDAPLGREHCGTCVRCIEACPTRAIVAPYQVDARLCISYLTIEHRGPIPRELRSSIGDWVFGCDICQEVCPWNRFAVPARDARLHARDLEGWTLERLLEIDEPGFTVLFAGSPIRRARREGLARNICVALGNRGRAESAPSLARAAAGDRDPVVRSHAVWALGQIGRRIPATAAERTLVERALELAQQDSSGDVREEAALAGSAMRGVGHLAAAAPG